MRPNWAGEGNEVKLAGVTYRFDTLDGRKAAYLTRASIIGDSTEFRLDLGNCLVPAA